MGASTSGALIGLARGDRGKRTSKVQILLEYDADVDERGPDGRTALHVAASAGDLNVVTLLIDHGASIDLEDDQGRTAPSLAIAAGKHAVVAALTSGVPMAENAPGDDVRIGRGRMPERVVHRGPRVVSSARTQARNRRPQADSSRESSPMTHRVISWSRTGKNPLTSTG